MKSGERLKQIQLIAAGYVEMFFGVGIEDNMHLSSTGRKNEGCLVRIKLPSLPEKYGLFRHKMWEFPWPEEPIWYKNVLETTKSLSFLIYFKDKEEDRWQWVGMTDPVYRVPAIVETFIQEWAFLGSFTTQISRNKSVKQPSAGKKNKFIFIRNSEAYQRYLLSNHWKNLRKKFSETHENVCSICGCSENLQLHHKNYKHLGHELHSDLAWLCKDCHSFVHHVLGVSKNKEITLQNVIDKIKNGQAF